jgi:hypothetical protein
MPKPPYFEHLPSSEKPPSMEHALEMARPRRGELEFPELTKEEKARLRSLLEEAKKAEEAIKGEPDKEKRKALYKEAIELYTEVKEEFLAIKEKKEKEKRGLFLEYEISLGEYDEVWDPCDIGGQIAFKAREGNKQFIIDHNGQRVGGEYDEVSAPCDIGGQIAFRAIEGDKEFIVNSKGEVVSEDYEKIYHLKPLKDNKAYIIAKKENKYIRKVIEI